MEKMENKGVLIGAIVFVFASFALMIGLLVFEAYRAKRQREVVASVKTEWKATPASVPRDFSMYKRIIGEDGREMVLIPEGPFTMGSSDGDPDEAPEHQVYLKSYYIDLKEVTQAEYERFLRATKRSKPGFPVFEDDQSKILKPELPAIGVSWLDAEAYCKWAGKRLPTEAEWEKAGRGESKRRYAWGDEFIPGYANLEGKEDGYQYLAPPGALEAGRSPYGVYDMTGNVAEWVADSYDENYYKVSPYRDPQGPPESNLKVIRGGSWRETPHNARLSKRFTAKMWRTDSTIGIRCARDAEDSPGMPSGKGSGTAPS
jgi:formylglycine-generating enzyme required for sulfatase activity